MVKNVQRRLAAILAADVVGYSRLMEANEEATARTLSTYREIIEGLVASHHGRVFGSAGDSIIAEFASPVEAVRCAVDIQRGLEAHNVDLPEDRRMRLRIGVNLGDVMVEGDNLLGDGVNIAARLETLADPGGISLSRSVFDQVKKQLDLGYEYLGEHEVKNIAEPVQVYRVLTGPEAAGKVIGARKRAMQSWKRMALAAVVSVLIGVAGAVTWLRPWEQTIEPASVGRMTHPLPDKPSIAVLPFANISDDTKQGYFADGMTEDLITDLSKVSSLTVIARNSTLSYNQQSPDFSEIGKTLGVLYVIAGSVRKAGETIRINVQLIEAATGRHIWAERYDKEIEDIFAIQDEVIGSVVSSLSVELTPDEIELIARKGTDNVEAFDLYMKGREQEGFFNKEANLAARDFYERTIALDPNYAEAYAHLSQIYALDAQFGWTKNVEGAYIKSLELARKAVKLNKDLPVAHFVLGRTLSRPVFAQYDQAIEEMDRVIALDPNYADGYAFLSLLYVYTGDAGRALGVIEKAMRINPIFPFWYYYALGMAQYTLTNYKAAVENLTMAAERNPTVFFVRYALAAALAKAGRQDDAEWQLDELYAMGFDMTLQEVMSQTPIQDPATRDSYFEGLRKAGFE